MWWLWGLWWLWWLCVDYGVCGVCGACGAHFIVPYFVVFWTNLWNLKWSSLTLWYIQRFSQNLTTPHFVVFVVHITIHHTLWYFEKIYKILNKVFWLCDIFKEFSQNLTTPYFVMFVVFVVSVVLLMHTTYPHTLWNFEINAS